MSSNASDQAAVNLITAKLGRPTLSAELVHRARLIDKLNRGRRLPLTLVSAPAGSGKTTLLSDWLATCPCPSAWLSLDEGDSHLAEFLTYLVAAVRTIVPDACDAIWALLRAGALPPPPALANLLIGELESLHDHPALASEGSLVLVLDDFHLIAGQAIDELMVEILRHPPSTLRLVIATRSDPALPLANLRARGQLQELRRHDLCFDAEETTLYLRQMAGQAASDEMVALLTQKTEGWIAGLHLAVLNLRAAADPTQFAAGVLANERHIVDYLLDEVLARQPQQLQQFLLRTSILDRICGPLADAVAGSGELDGQGGATLEHLEGANLFLVALDNHHQWYRYHHLFQQALHSRLLRRVDAAEIAGLHSRASAWYASQGLVDDAIVHALAAGDQEAAVQVVEAHRHWAMNHEHWQQLERWLRLMPRSLVNRRPELLLAEAWILTKQWRMLDMAPYLEQIERLLPPIVLQQPETRYLRGECDALRSAVCYYSHEDERAYQLASRALQTVPVTRSGVRGLAYMYCAGGLQSTGDIQGAIRLLHDGLKEDARLGDAFPSRPLTALCTAYWISGDLSALRQTAHHFLRLAEEHGMQESVGWARYFLGCVAYQLNDLAAAEQAFAAVVEMRYLTNGLPFSQSAFGLALIWLAQGGGSAGAARALVQSVIDYGLETANTRVLEDARAFQARLALKEGRRAEAFRWAEQALHHRSSPPMITFQVAVLTLAEILHDQGTADSLSEARRLLTSLVSLAEQQGNTRCRIEALALQALVDETLGDRVAALAALRQAVDLAEPTGIVRIFVDLGPGMARLLGRLGRPDAAGFVGELLRAFPAAGASPAPGPTFSVPLLASPSVSFEPLTGREQQILALLAERLSAKEMAEHLVISDQTVKRHVANIYQKLGVHNRREALAVAAANGLLS